MRDAEWAARPCLHEWKLDERPCLWFRSGDGCRETWADEPGAAFAVVRVAALCVLSALSAYTASAFWAARTDRLLRGINERWNALEHLALLAWLAVNVLDRFPLDLAHFWTSDRLSGRSQSVDAFLSDIASRTPTLKRR